MCNYLLHWFLSSYTSRCPGIEHSRTLGKSMQVIRTEKRFQFDCSNVRITWPQRTQKSSQSSEGYGTGKCTGVWRRRRNTMPIEARPVIIENVGDLPWKYLTNLFSPTNYFWQNTYHGFLQLDSNSVIRSRLMVAFSPRNSLSSADLSTR